MYLKTLPDGEPVALTNDSLKKMRPDFFAGRVTDRVYDGQFAVRVGYVDRGPVGRPAETVSSAML